MAELIWEGKYRADGKRAGPVRLALPFQTVETVNESAQDRRRTLDLFSAGKPIEWKNRLIWGDKKYVLPSLLPEFAGKVNLIYIDPPFDTGADFSFSTEIPGSDESLVKQPSIIEQKAYRDTWGRGLNSYLQWFYDTAQLLHELLSDTGSLYVHLEPDVGNHVRVVLDEVFGPEALRTEIAWKRTSSHGNVSTNYGEIWECIFFYTKSAEEWTWNQQHIPFDPAYVEKHFTGLDADGRRWTTSDLVNPGYRPNLFYEYKGYRPHRNGWKISKEKMLELDRQGRLYFPKDKTGRIRLKRYLDEAPGQIAQNLWLEIAPINSQAHEALGYATQKPEALLERIIKTSSHEGDLVLDCFCGSGTTSAVAEKLRRRWIAADLGRFAIHTTRKRLLNTAAVKPFVVQNLGKYERQAWMAEEFAKPEDRAATEASYRRFILDLYAAEPFDGGTWLHGIKAGRMVHVGAVDAPVTVADVKAVAREVWRAAPEGATERRAAADILGWEFAFELNETAKQLAAEARVDVKFRRIPREVLEKAAVDQGDIQAKDFFELRALSTKVTKSKRQVTVELTDFVLPSEDLPEEVARAVKHWSQWIDYWAIDWDFKGDTFHNQWQSFRTGEQPELTLKIASPDYTGPGRYAVVVKVIDILGNDTTKVIEVEVK